jgi:diguanylate cyclase (GGDEF)-like protein
VTRHVFKGSPETVESMTVARKETRDTSLTGMEFAQQEEQQRRDSPHCRSLSMKPSFVSVPSGTLTDSSETPTLNRQPRNRGRLAELARENDELRRRVAELEDFRLLAYKDQLTGLWNRRYFDDRIAEELDRARRNPNRQLSLMVIDLNDLKRLNDTSGHGEGDRALRWVASFLRAHLRAHDICCRTGGDEFAVILPDVGSDGCETLTNRLRDQMASGGSHASGVGLSVGTATFRADAHSVADLIRMADQAMYRDKFRQKTDILHPISA